MRSYLFLSLLTGLIILNNAQAENAAILSANNQASVDLLWQHQNLTYHDNPNAYPLYNLHGTPLGLNFALNKTFGHLYTQLNLSVTNANLSNNNPTLNLSRAASFIQETNGRVGYSFFPQETFGLTPYVMLGYQHWQLDTGGTTLLGFKVNGITQIYELAHYGGGLLAQWAAKPNWVLSSEFMLFSTIHPWTYATAPLAGQLFYEQADLESPVSWQLAVGSDYKITPQLHTHLGLQYRQAAIGSSSQASLNPQVPAAQNHLWQVNAGLGYELDNLASHHNSWGTPNKQALIQANNEAAFYAGDLFQDYGEIEAGKPGYLDRQTGQMPQLSIALSKTWKNIFGQIALSEALGITRYDGQDVFTHQPLTGTIRNTMTDLAGRLGYQLFPIPYISATPYGTLGYHRWLRSISYPETYHHDWAGLGLLLQWAPFSNLVLSIDGNTGYSFNAQVHAWNTFFPPFTVLNGFSLGSRSYVMATLGGDYRIAQKWHLLAKVNYWRFNYQQSPVNALGLYEPTSNTRLLAASLGLGYSLD